MVKITRWIEPAFQFLVVLILIGLGSAGGLLGWWLRDLPAIRALEELQPARPSAILSKNGVPLLELGRENRDPAKLRELPELLVKAVLAAEDWSFYSHTGIDPLGIARAFLTNLRSRRLRQGGSTITQQLTKVLFLTPERTARRKVREIVLALEIERTYSKNQILELYLNTIYFGQGAYGIKTAARLFFSKSPAELDVAQCATLAGLIQGPSLYNPARHPKRAVKRRNIILGRMLRKGVIDATTHRQAIAQNLMLRLHASPPAKARDFTEAVRRILLEELGLKLLYEGGLTIRTTLDLELQQIAQQALEEQLRALERRKNPEENQKLQAAVIVMNAETGEILALVGGRNSNAGSSHFNRAFQARRQPGSLFKPIVWAAALENGLSGASIVDDLPTELLDRTGKVVWSPKNFSKKNYGPTTLREALVHSRNIVSVHLFQRMGADLVIDYARRMGIRSSLPAVPSLALGSGEVRPVEIARVYGCLAAGGVTVKPRLIRAVMDSRGMPVFQTAPEHRRAISERSAYMLLDILRDVVIRGTGRRAALKSTWIAGKTGTTNGFTDAWFAGLAPPLVIVVWVGYDEPKPIPGKATGGRAAAPIFRKILQEAEKRITLRKPVRPQGLLEKTIDATTGLLAKKGCPRKQKELFPENQVPPTCNWPGH